MCLLNSVDGGNSALLAFRTGCCSAPFFFFLIEDLNSIHLFSRLSVKFHEPAPKEVTPLKSVSCGSQAHDCYFLLT